MHTKEVQYPCHMSHIDPPSTLKTGKKPPKKTAIGLSNERRLKVGEVAQELGITPRHLARLAKQGVPGVVRAANGYRFDWYDRPETRDWIADRRRFRKGQRKRNRPGKGRLSAVQLLVRAMSRTETNLFRYVTAVLKGNVTPAQLAAVEDAGRRLERLAGRIIGSTQGRARHG